MSPLLSTVKWEVLAMVCDDLVFPDSRFLAASNVDTGVALSYVDPSDIWLGNPLEASRELRIDIHEFVYTGAVISRHIRTHRYHEYLTISNDLCD